MRVPSSSSFGQSPHLAATLNALPYFGMCWFALFLNFWAITQAMSPSCTLNSTSSPDPSKSLVLQVSPWLPQLAN